MNEFPPAPAPKTLHPGWTALGITFIVLWVLAHIVLFFLSFLGGFFADLMLYFLKGVMLPGLVINSSGMEMGWVVPLQIGVTLAGLAGIPAGLAFFWRSYRLRLLLLSGGLFLGGLAFEIYAIYRLIADSLGGLAPY